MVTNEKVIESVTPVLSPCRRAAALGVRRMVFDRRKTLTAYITAYRDAAQRTRTIHPVLGYSPCYAFEEVAMAALEQRAEEMIEAEANEADRIAERFAEGV